MKAKKYQLGGLMPTPPAAPSSLRSLPPVMDEEMSTPNPAAMEAMRGIQQDVMNQRGYDMSRRMERAENEGRPLKEIMKDFGKDKKKPAKKSTKMASGGYVRKADGCAQRGKTRGKMV